MKTHQRPLASILAITLFAATSSASMAASEAQFSIYDQSARMETQQAQAGPAGPASTTMESAWANSEASYSAYHLAAQQDMNPAGQAGRAGPASIDGSTQNAGNLETRHSIYDREQTY